MTLTADDFVHERPDPDDALVGRVLRFANRLHEFLGEVGRPEAARRITDEAAIWSRPLVTVVVAGDIKRGKSSLINALFERDLLPVDSDVATGVYVVVRFDPLERAWVTRMSIDGQPVKAEIAPEEIAALASLSPDRAAETGITMIEVGCDDPLLAKGIVLVDTPGLGGLTPGHRDIALATIATSDLLIFTISVEEPVARSEIEFLASSLDRMGNVVVAMTKTDRNADWPEMAHEDRARLLAYSAARAVEEGSAPGSTPHAVAQLGDAAFVPLSSRLARRARQQIAEGRPEAAAESRRRSGFDQLVRRLEVAIDEREVMRLRNVVQLCQTIVTRVEAEELTRARNADLDSGVDAELDREQALLDDALHLGARWRQRFTAAMQRAQAEANSELGRLLSELEGSYRRSLHESRRDIVDRLDELPTELERSTGAVWLELANWLTPRIVVVVDDLIDELGLDRHDLDPAAHIEPPTRVVASPTSELSPPDFDLLEDGVPLLTQGAIFGRLIAYAAPVVGVAAGGPALIVGGLVGGAIALPIAGLKRKRRAELRSMQEHQRLVRDTVSALRRDLGNELAVRLVELRVEVERAIDMHLRDSRRDFDDRRRELNGLRRQEIGERQRVRANAESAVARARTLKHEAAELRRLLDESRSGP